MEFDVRIDSAGEGWFTHQEFVSQGSCGTTACGQVEPNEGRANSFHMREAEPSELVTFLLCVHNEASPRHCEYTFTLTQPTVHTYSFNALNVTPHGGFTFDCPEMDGLLRTEAAGPLSGESQAYQNVEIRHN